MKMHPIQHERLVRSLQKAYSAEKAAAFAYIGHAGSLKSEVDEQAIHRIERDEWDHRRNVLAIMHRWEIPVARWYELKYHVIGKIIGASCYLIGRFMPYFFAGKLESGNVCEYIVMMRYFNELGIDDHDEVLYEMGLKEKEHEVYFQEIIRNAPWLPLFERVFNWGAKTSLNDVEFENPLPLKTAGKYCKGYGKGQAGYEN